ncbi:MAG TPA: DUF4369 domain-containing protein, partial [Flavobacterium sp.]|nr:DUF4369 domain-containing protein [Flavobacterium sp.]
MKKILVVFSGVILAFVACDSKKVGNTHISGEIKGLKQGTLYIQQVKDSTLVTLDSIVLKGSSKFESSFDLEEPEVLYLGLNRGTSQSVDNLILFFAEPGNLTVNSSLENFSSGAVMEGSENQTLYTKYLKTRSSISNKQTELIRDHLLAQKNNQIQKADSLEKAIQRTANRYYLNAVNFALKNNTKEVSPYIALTDIATINPKYLDTIYGNLSPDVAK